LKKYAFVACNGELRAEGAMSNAVWKSDLAWFDGQIAELAR
jgi:hypothetical protein